MACLTQRAIAQRCERLRTITQLQRHVYRVLELPVNSFWLLPVWFADICNSGSVVMRGKTIRGTKRPGITVLGTGRSILLLRADRPRSV
jgi:hypothetical protein